MLVGTLILVEAVVLAIRAIRSKTRRFIIYSHTGLALVLITYGLAWYKHRKAIS